MKMKKILRSLSAVMLCTVMAVGLMFTLSACGEDGNRTETIGVGLEHGVTYALSATWNMTNGYNTLDADSKTISQFVFNADGTGTYRFSDAAWYTPEEIGDPDRLTGTIVRDYTVHFKYVDYSFTTSMNRVVCTLDLVAYGPNNRIASVSSNWNKVLLVQQQKKETVNGEVVKPITQYQVVDITDGDDWRYYTYNVEA